MLGWNILYPCKPKDSGLYRPNLLSQWRQDVKPESWAENNPLVKAVLSIHLWKKRSFLYTPRLPTPCTWAFKHIHSLYRQTHTYTNIQECFAWIWHPCIDVRPPAPSVLSVSVCDGDCGVCVCVEFCCSAVMWVCAHHVQYRLNVCVFVCVCQHTSVCICRSFVNVCVCVCATHAADTLQHLGRSLRRLGNGWSGNTRRASSLWKNRGRG